MNELAPFASPEAIDKCTARLAVAFQRQIDAATVRVYRETMSDLPLWAIEGAELVLRRRGGEFFPSAPTWHQTAEQLIADRQRELVATPSDGVHECAECRDQGWAEILHADKPPTYLPCSCRATNSRYQRQQAAGRKQQSGSSSGG
jgi:hypothetical protein